MLSTFNDVLNSDRFIVTAEVAPPKGTDISATLEDAELIRGLVDAINITDNQRAVMRMSPIAVGKLLMDAGHEVIVQLTCRDRNRLALQSDILAASALGIENLCVMTGDYTTKGDHVGAKAVYDLDSVQLLSLITKMMGGSDMAGNELAGAPSFTVGAVSNTDVTKRMQMLKLKKKINAGARFIQTQAVYDVESFKDFSDLMGQIGPNVLVLAGIIPLRSAAMAHFMNNNIPGIRVGDELIKRMENAKDPIQEGLEIAAESILELRDLCRGIHLMPIGGHGNTQRLLEMAGLDNR
ncbi:methylenetetrahydrofolate reductase [Methanococcoides burtonii]|uniref:Methylenetetrahydrofolate reductase n=1 Tax=Methanococcoides burtonii (strain DSM 6242 / NBRC 107633 / OCM 468 / ACE-M) TaxID=259564 RepID=Q12UZ6_METBU|nr:methylenetetrahydrofolate reductase [Methanococcoides burtonii]ABE52730.1 methylenetetrahydrofolate reductase [Methanococcoides burtonii DSM 6242]